MIKKISLYGLITAGELGLLVLCREFALSDNLLAPVGVVVGFLSLFGWLHLLKQVSNNKG